MARKIVSIIDPGFSVTETCHPSRMNSVAAALSLSFEVHVFTLVRDGKKHTEIETEKGTIHVHTIQTPRIDRISAIFRPLIDRWNAFQLVKESNKINADLLIVSTSSLPLLKAALLRSVVKRKIAGVYDLFESTSYKMPFLKSYFRKRRNKLMQKYLDMFDSVVVNSYEERRCLLVDAALPAFRIEVLPEGVSSRMFEKIAASKFRADENCFTITYSGPVNSELPFLGLFEFIGEMKEFKMNIIGDGEALKKLSDIVQKKKLFNVRLTGRLTREQVIACYRKSDLLFAAAETHRCNVPMNLYEYLATGLPVLLQGSGFAADFLRSFKNTFIYSGGDNRSLQKLLMRIRKMKLVKTNHNREVIERNFISEKINHRFSEIVVRLLNDTEASGVFIEDLLLGKEQ